ncbi:alpha/beta hydrolase [Nocardioides fonticola]|uniref:alpha/beta fold hydrolase n=1 Tax=Nocardioides fonticola TaxID=450363 RepID=UPI0031DEF369
MSARPSPAALAWRDAGRRLQVGPHEVFVASSIDAGTGTPVLALHGYPGSSFDLAGVLPHLGRPWLAPDLLGYGFSDKPLDASYSLFEQADLVEQVVAQTGVDRVVLLAHDMGTTVASELLARQSEGRLGFVVEQVFLTNGSIFIDLAQLSRGQRLGLRIGPRVLPFPMPTPMLRRSLRESIAPGTAVSPAALDDLVALIQLGGGARVIVQQLTYLLERRAHQPRFTAGLVDFPGPLTAIWGLLDPIAVPTMPRHLRYLRPATEIVELDGVGHWPPIEAPERVAAEIRARL